MAEKLAEIAARFEGLTQAVWLWDAGRRRILWANKAGRAFWSAQSLFDLAVRIFAAESAEARAMAKAGRAIQAALDPPGGPVRAILDVADISLPFAPSAKVVRLAGIATSPHPASQALRGELFTMAPAGLCLMDAQGVRMEANRAWEGVTGAYGQRLSGLIGEERAARFLLAAIASGRAQLTAEAGGRRLRLTAKRLKRAGGEAPLVYVRGEDVTVEHALETLLTHRAELVPASGEAPAASQRPEDTGLAARLAEAERKSRAKSDFIARLSHEMRNPLNAIIGFSEIMQQRHFGPLGDARYESYAADIRMSAEHLLSLVNDLLDLARIEAGQLKLEFDGVALPALVDECVRLLRPQAANYGVQVEILVPANLPPVVADARSLKQVLINLISNALKFTGEGGTVRVSAENDAEGGIVVRVADTGVGMSRGEVQLALEPFGQVDGAMQKTRRGTGLGLPVAKALAEANKAVFRIESEPQRGTKVELMFPSTRVLAG